MGPSKQQEYAHHGREGAFSESGDLSLKELEFGPSTPAKRILTGIALHSGRMGAFDYRSCPLGDDEIRILELLPALNPDDSVKTRISRADLRNPSSLLPVSALSYCWGDQHNRRPVEIAIGSDTFSITASLEMALRALRQHEPDQSIFLWIDQICINQHDSDEKSRQIPLMNRIYSLSAQTIGWLGESTSDSDLAMDYLSDIGARAHSLGLASLTDNTLQVLLSEDEDVDAGILSIEPTASQTRGALIDLIAAQGNLLKHPALEGMVQLTMLPYFKRGWIQQEIAIPQNLILHWGSKTIGPDIFAAGVWFHHIWIVRSISSLTTPAVYADSAARSLLERITAPDARFPTHIIPSLTTRRWYHSPVTRGKLTMASPLRRLHSVQFTKARDRVYGILGIAVDRTPSSFAVDTTRKWEDVFTDATRHIVTSGDSSRNSGDGIDFLSLVAFPKKSGGSMPSWVPDLNHLGHISTLRSDTTALVPPYRAGGSSTQQGLDCGDPSVLRCRGVIIDTITDLGPAWEVDPTGQCSDSAGLVPLAAMAELATRSRDIVTSSPNSKHPFHNRPDRLSEAEWRVPVLDRESVASTSASRRATALSRAGHEVVKYMMLFESVSNDVYKILSDIPLSPEEIAELDRTGLAADSDQRKVAEVKLKIGKTLKSRKSQEYITYRSLMGAFEARRSFLGVEGFVGVGPLGMQPGDTVCILYGASFPFILRKKGEIPIQVGTSS
ncbi:heterokaryon incompatibility protein-domain-containing protein [Podospora aff. communis PSN243]|uniref:Heterokaryon incompatibility protein-domain-containing protein n=1 Tax=Podospora aff. communis PSN243 TaxID=3040156 RepID=A0AAV9H6C2_9PEZI|nr:heterokaryon incompatibility protein-domain-containing protein [Podospora aff. communis PSN243]